MNKFDAIIFDMDGLLIDSMLYWVNLDQAFFKKHGIDLTDDIVRYFSGRKEQENMEWMKENFKIKDSVEDLIKKRYKETDLIYSQKTELMPGAEKLVRFNKEKNIQQAIATGSPYRHLNLVKERFSWWDNHFNLFVSVDEVKKGKPDPAVYLYTAEKLKVDPKKCVVFEDAENGLMSAKAAGMKCIAVPDARWSPGDFSKADLIADSLEDEKIFKFLNL